MNPLDTQDDIRRLELLGLPTHGNPQFTPSAGSAADIDPADTDQATPYDILRQVHGHCIAGEIIALLKSRGFQITGKAVAKPQNEKADSRESASVESSDLMGGESPGKER